jgi:CubicO group peptidase (beta-lactamase class C family)
MRFVAKSLLVLLLITVPTSLLAQEALSADTRAAIDKAAAEILAKTGAPSASIAVVKDGKIAYEHAYGTANLEAKTPATPQMRYSIRSRSSSRQRRSCSWPRKGSSRSTTKWCAGCPN